MKNFSRKYFASILLLTGVITIQSLTGFSNNINSSFSIKYDISDAIVHSDITPSSAVGDTTVSSLVSGSNPSAVYYYDEIPTLAQNDLLYQYFKNSVIVGDSIGAGWGIQCIKNSTDPVMGNFQSLAFPGFCVHSAFDASIEDAGTPMYKGAKRPVWESLQLMAAEHPGETTHIYLHFGYKDQQWKDTPELYVQLIQTLQQYVPDSDITIIGASYMYPGKNGEPYTSANIKTLDLAMQNYANAYGWGFVNVGDLLADQNGDLNPAYCSDKFMHLNASGYDIWKKALIGYALARMTAAGII
ncbi:SGNH/GDSL hydrolase family protein [Oribacterium sp. WCC10]|uniref:SGNH/GDSL hydrolase family protein n=1 Tax=Oribacterium sp. WCC10 TaxID=1855343 RepID=UPI0008E12B82|nr:SGNH/GDSL hydrolase family protein [Oribacterium sp. WCC10]SFG13377.1 Lysophospholipase L1 [Oribacterium sp. WCC10]